MNPEIQSAAKIVWDYHHMNQSLEKADCIIVLGSSDIRVAEYGVELFKRELAPHIIFSGGLGSLTKDRFGQTEAEIFAEVAAAAGIPDDAVLLEKKSTNTGENILFSMDLLSKNHISANLVIIVTKPYMERRVFATAKKLFPSKNFIVSSPPISFENYPTEKLGQELVVSIMVGDLQRIMEYPAKGYQIEMDVPDEVKNAYRLLIESGHNKHLIK